MAKYLVRIFAEFVIFDFWWRMSVLLIYGVASLKIKQESLRKSCFLGVKHCDGETGLLIAKRQFLEAGAEVLGF